MVPDKLQNAECSVVVCTYKPVWEKLRLTLKSVLLQENCNMHIVVTDDGSEENCFDRIRDYFAKHSFRNYELVASSQNQGTTKNILQGVQASVGEFVKPLSPGDFLHGRNALRKWIDFMRERKDCIMSFCDAIYYHMEKGKIFATKEYAHPQYANVCGGGTSLRNYLLVDDICLGAASLVRRELWIKYLEMISGKVVYAEDNSYRIMMYCGEKFAYLPQSLLLYEYGSGISTSGSDVWAKRLRKDWLAANTVMLESKPCKEAVRLQIPEFLRIFGKSGWYGRLQRWWISPARLCYGLKYRFFPRFTPTDVDEAYAVELLSSDT